MPQGDEVLTWVEESLLRLLVPREKTEAEIVRNPGFESKWAVLWFDFVRDRWVYRRCGRYETEVKEGSVSRAEYLFPGEVPQRALAASEAAAWAASEGADYLIPILEEVYGKSF